MSSAPALDTNTEDVQMTEDIQKPEPSNEHDDASLKTKSTDTEESVRKDEIVADDDGSVQTGVEIIQKEEDAGKNSLQKLDDHSNENEVKSTAGYVNEPLPGVSSDNSQPKNAAADDDVVVDQVKNEDPLDDGTHDTKTETETETETSRDQHGHVMSNMEVDTTVDNKDTTNATTNPIKRRRSSSAGSEEVIKTETQSQEDTNGIHSLLEKAIVEPTKPHLTYYGLKTGICYDVRMRYHSRIVTSSYDYVDPHPEDPRRIYRIYKAIAEAGLLIDPMLQGADDLGPLMQKIPVREASESEILLVHTKEHLDFIESSAKFSRDRLIEETEKGDSIYLNNDSLFAAKLSCGGAIEACRAVVERRVKNAIAVVRPPGHHAEPNAPGGFCLFSNVAVAANVMLKTYPESLRRILVVDWDVHHGNGTQRAFMDDPRVLYVSLHRYEDAKFYPGTTFGAHTVVGDGPGAGYTVNIPWDIPGMGDADYMYAFQRVIMPIATEFDPDLVIISSGFDAAEGDIIGGCLVTPNAYGQMTHMLKSLANGNLVVVLEGGYTLSAIAASALAVTKVLLGDPPGVVRTKVPSQSAIKVVDKVLKVHSKYWESVRPGYGSIRSTVDPSVDHIMGSNDDKANIGGGVDHSRGPDVTIDSNTASNASANGNGTRTASSNNEESRVQNANSNANSDSNSAANGNANSNGNTAETSNVPTSVSLTSDSSASVLADALRLAQAADLFANFQMTSLPVVKSSFSAPIENQILATPDIHKQETVIVILHDSPEVWGARDACLGNINAGESLVLDGARDFISWATKPERNYGVVDICIPEDSKLQDDYYTPYVCAQETMLYFWDNYVEFFSAKNIVFIGVGEAYSGLVYLVGHREVRHKADAVIAFTGTAQLKSIVPIIDEYVADWFFKSSLIFTSRDHVAWDPKVNAKKPRKKFGRVLQCQSSGLYETIKEKFDETVGFVEELLE